MVAVAGVIGSLWSPSLLSLLIIKDGGGVRMHFIFALFIVVSPVATCIVIRVIVVIAHIVDVAQVAPRTFFEHHQHIRH